MLVVVADAVGVEVVVVDVVAGAGEAEVSWIEEDVGELTSSLGLIEGLSVTSDGGAVVVVDDGSSEPSTGMGYICCRS